MPWLQLRVTADRNLTTPIEDALLATGAASVTLQDNADQPILEPALGETPLWDNTLVTGLFEASVDTAAITARLEQLLDGELPHHRWEQLEDKDWEREWMNNFHPLHCGGDLWICPSWREVPDPSATNLMLDPGLAFGTGTHPTTFMCLQWIAEEAKKHPFSGKTIIDYGCGSGILGIAAVLLGAERFTGTDIDPQALIATRDNAKRNNISPDRCPVYLPDELKLPGQNQESTQSQENGQADYTLANILAGPLTELAPVLAELTRSGGKLCLSGILDSQVDKVIPAYAPWFDFDPVRRQQEWACLSAVKR